jgi:F0F1-type ATP synthase assembly protein I
MPDRPESFDARSTRSLQENLQRGEPGILASYRLTGAILVLGGIGFALDRWNGTSPWFLIAGLVVGLIVGLSGLAIAMRRHE